MFENIFVVSYFSVFFIIVFTFTFTLFRIHFKRKYYKWITFLRLSTQPLTVLYDYEVHYSKLKRFIISSYDPTMFTWSTDVHSYNFVIYLLYPCSSSLCNIIKLEALRGRTSAKAIGY